MSSTPRAAGGYDKAEMTHLSFGSVLGKDGKPIKTREGGAVSLEALLDEAVKRAGEVYEAGLKEAQDRGEPVADLSDEEKRQIYEVIGIGAVKYADLCQNRTSDYKFDFDKMLAMNGNTATYMQYAYARNRSIFRKGGEEVDRFRKQPPLPTLESPHERMPALQLLRLEENLTTAALGVSAEPHHVVSMGPGQDVQRVLPELPCPEGSLARTAREPAAAVRPDGPGAAVVPGSAGDSHGGADVTDQDVLLQQNFHGGSNSQPSRNLLRWVTTKQMPSRNI